MVNRTMCLYPVVPGCRQLVKPALALIKKLLLLSQRQSAQVISTGDLGPDAEHVHYLFPFSTMGFYSTPTIELINNIMCNFMRCGVE